MALCPCNCGRNLGFMKRRLAQHAVDLTIAFPIIARLGEIEATMPPEVRPNAAGLLSTGQSMSTAMLASAHGAAVPALALPSMSELAQWRQLANLAAGSVDIADHAFITSYTLGLPLDAQRLVRSMVTNANRMLARASA